MLFFPKIPNIYTQTWTKWFSTLISLHLLPLVSAFSSLRSVLHILHVGFCSKSGFFLMLSKRWRVFFSVCRRSCCRTSAFVFLFWPTHANIQAASKPDLLLYYCQHRLWNKQMTSFTTCNFAQPESSQIQPVISKHLEKGLHIPRSFRKSNRETGWAPNPHIQFVQSSWKKF